MYRECLGLRLKIHRLAVPSRRDVVAAITGVAMLSGIPGLAHAATTMAGDPFSFDILSERMRALASKPLDASAPEALPAFVGAVDYDSYRKIVPKGDLSLSEDPLGYRLQPFHVGWLFQEPVHLYQVDDGVAQPIAYTADDFEYLDPELAAAADHQALPGVAGFRLSYPLNKPDELSELVAFLGASYFRALGRDNVYGASARAVVLNSWVELMEEFPRYSAFYVERTEPGQPMTVYAALEGPSVTGALKFAFDPADADRQDTLVDVTARFFFRADVKEVGIAPLTSMFLFAEGNRSRFDDYRPQVHDSNGLWIKRRNGEAIWRALNNTTAVGNSYLADENPAAFGLMQRDRDFESYQDAGAHYERRPSILVEPVGDWGRGAIRLIEIPAKLEADDNIVAFWIPEKPFKAGDSAEFEYRLRWGDLAPEADGDLAYVAETRTGRGGTSGVENADNLRKFVVDFTGGPLTGLAPDTKLDAVVNVGPGSVSHVAISPVDGNKTWRLVIDAEIPSGTPIELRAYLVGNGRQLSETWLYQWLGP